MKVMKINLAFLLLLPVAAFALPHVEETMTLAKGWNAIYLESTPTNPVCAEFFAGAPVARVASYHSDAYSSTRQLADDGTEITQKPISYYVWLPDDETASTMTGLVGGNVYLIYATEAWATNFIGTPAAPRQTWRATSGETSFMNLAGVSAETNVSVAAKKYFGEGPFGSGVAYQIGGTNTAAPTFLPMVLGTTSKLQGGKAYALTATKDGDWPGVIGVSGDSVYFSEDVSYATIAIRNCGTTNRTFRFAMVRSDDWEERGEVLPPISRRLPRVDAFSEQAYTNVVENGFWDVTLEPNEVAESVFSLDRSQLAVGTEYGAILTIKDLGGSEMRVRLPIIVEAVPQDTVAYPTGLWVGEIALSRVSGIDDATPVTAGGLLKMSVMMFVDANRKCTLLQRVATGVDTNGAMRLFKELANVPPEIENPRRFSTVMMSVDTPVVEASDGSTFGTNTVFSWTIDAKARDNPFRHAWHPDHDGKTADYKGEAPSGDVFENYAQPIKPELWSISNRLEVSWHEQGNSTLPVHFPYNADETTSGVVTWEVWGLVANGPIKSIGTFTLKRVVNAKELEE